MTFHRQTWGDLGITAEISLFTAAPAASVASAASAVSAAPEAHVVFHVDPSAALFPEQLSRLYAAQERLLLQEPLSGFRPVFKRYFLSDATNQAPLFRPETDCALSIIQQPPLDGSKVALWMYLQRDHLLSVEGDVLVSEHNGYRHLWFAGLDAPEGDSAHQTTALLTHYGERLSRFGATLADHCVRTWFFARDVDTHYAGLVRARLEYFERHGLTPDTHYISSTGIGGAPANTAALVRLDAYALLGFHPQQQRYLQALTHLNPTIEYGVTFERGTLLEFGDRAHAYISGTASIDNRGRVVHPGDIVRQTRRMWDNVEALLAEADMNFADHAAHAIVYLRDPADYLIVRRLFAERYPQVPTVFTLAPVCRPEWLIEMECIAIAPRCHENFRPF